MSLTSYRAAPPRDFTFDRFERDVWGAVCGSGGDLLSHALRRSTIGAAGLNGRVREGIGCFPRAVTAGPAGRALGGVSAGASVLRARSDVFPSRVTRRGVSEATAGLPPAVFRGAIKPIERLVPVD